MASEPERSGLLFLHVWVEAETDDGLRARLTEVSEGSGAERTVGTARTIEEIVDIVRSWVGDLSTPLSDPVMPS